MIWEPIEKFDRLGKREKITGDFAFLFEEDRSRRQYLPRIVKTDRVFGNRACIAFCQLPKRDSFMLYAGETT
jgi:hypothetical protein